MGCTWELPSPGYKEKIVGGNEYLNETVRNSLIFQGGLNASGIGKDSKLGPIKTQSKQSALIQRLRAR